MTLHHVVEGHGPPLVLAGSLGTTHRLWDPQVAALAKRYRVVRYDHPVTEDPHKARARSRAWRARCSR